jgi:hypothetical protein
MSPRPITISWSQLRTHTECRQKSALLRAGKRNPAQNLRSYIHGMIVDHVMRAWLADPDHPAGAMVGMVTQAITDVIDRARHDGDGIVRWKSATDRAEMHTFCTDLVTRLEPLLRQLVLPHSYTVGHRFKVPATVPYLDNTPVTIHLIGEMDLLVHEPAGYAVWDLKGTRDDNYWRKVAGQLIFYDLAVMGAHAARTTRVGLIQPMCTRATLEFVVTDEHRRQMWTHILRMAADIWREDTTCRQDTANCPWCEVRHACARFTNPNAILGPALRQEIPA